MVDGVEMMWTRHPNVIYVDPSQALETLYALQKNSASLQAIDNHQRGRLSSRVSGFGGAVRRYLAKLQVTPGKDDPPHTATVLASLRQSLGLARHALDGSLREVEDPAWGISEPLGETERVKVSPRPGMEWGCRKEDREGRWST